MTTWSTCIGRCVTRDVAADRPSELSTQSVRKRPKAPSANHADDVVETRLATPITPLPTNPRQSSAQSGGLEVPSSNLGAPIKSQARRAQAEVHGENRRAQEALLHSASLRYPT